MNKYWEEIAYNAAVIGIIAGLFLFLILGIVLTVETIFHDSAAASPPPRPIALELEYNLQQADDAFAKQVRALSPQSLDYWQRVWALWEHNNLSVHWKAYENALHDNAEEERLANERR